MKLCLYCTCMRQLARPLPEDALRAALGPGIRLVAVNRLCDEETCRRTLLAELPSANAAQPSVVAAACSGGARGAQALACIRAAGQRAELADVREGCVWPGAAGDGMLLAEQAAALIRMAFARLEQPHAPAEEKNQAVGERGVLVVGAGPAGLAAAHALSGFGVPVTLADRRPTTGGMLNQLGPLFPRMTSAADLLASLAPPACAPASSEPASAPSCPTGVELRTGTEVTELRPEQGGYTARFRQGGEESAAAFGAVILATGAQPVLPGEAFRAKELKGVISQMELDTLITAVEQGRKPADVLPASAVFVQCVHARNAEKPYCSAVCCPTAVKNALRLKSLRPDTDITILNQQMVMPGIALENLYRKAMNAGVRFLHVEDASSIRVEGREQVEAVTLTAPDGTEKERLTADRLVCSTPLLPGASTANLARQLDLRVNAMGFLPGHEPAHPLESSAEGVFICGSARWPAYADQAVEQGRAAAVLATRFLREGRMPMDEIPDQGPAARIRPERCSGCGRCVEACPHGACRIGADGKSLVEPELCRRCGVCAAVCPCDAAFLPEASPSPRELLAALSARPVQRRLS